MRIWNWFRRRRLRRLRRFANKRFVTENDRLDRLLRNAKTLLDAEKAKVKVMEAEKTELYAVIARNKIRVEAETAMAAHSIAALTGPEQRPR